VKINHKTNLKTYLTAECKRFHKCFIVTTCAVPVNPKVTNMFNYCGKKYPTILLGTHASQILAYMQQMCTSRRYRVKKHRPGANPGDADARKK